MGVKQIGEDHIARQFMKVSFLPVGAYGDTPFAWEGKLLSFSSMSNPEKNILKNKVANQRKES